MSKAKAVRGALGAFTDLFEPVAKDPDLDLINLPPMWESQINPSPYFSSASNLLDSFPSQSVPSTGYGIGGWYGGQIKKGKLSKDEINRVNLLPHLEEAGSTPISIEKVKNLAESRSPNLTERLSGRTTAIKAIDEQMDDIHNELDFVWANTNISESSRRNVQRQLSEELDLLRDKKDELITREIDAGTYSRFDDINTFAMDPSRGWWLEGGTGHRELRINSPHVSYSQVKPTETASAPFIDDWNRVQGEIDNLVREVDDAIRSAPTDPATIWLRHDFHSKVDPLLHQRNFLHDKMIDATVAENPSIYGHRIWRDDHWPDDENVLAHVRFSDRFGPDGEKILVIEEIQSTIHQKGNASWSDGYAKQISPPDKKPMSLDEYKEYQRLIIARGIAGDKSHLMSDADKVNFDNFKLSDEAWTNYHNSMDIVDKGYIDDLGGPVPNLPYSKNWHELVLRRAMQLAAREGYARVAFVPFERQMVRNSGQSLFAREIEYRDGKLMAYDENGDQLLGQPDDEFVRVGRKEVKNWIGEDAAKQLFDSPNYFNRSDALYGKAPDIADFGFYSHQGLEVGGKFLRDIYDAKLPRYIEKISGSKIEMKMTGPENPSAHEVVNLPTVKVNSEVVNKLTEDGVKYAVVPPVAALPAVNLDDGEAD
jgi:hypothetical protein